MSKEVHVSEFKKREVELLKDLTKKYRVIALADLTGMPSPPLQKMRRQLDGILIRISKKRLIKIALEQLDDSKLIKLREKLEGIMPCLIFSNDGSFKLAKELRRGKMSAPAKAGQIAPRDLVISKGPTPFPPGPIIGELGALGIKAGVEQGKVAVKEDAILVKKGEGISAKVADILSKLGEEPMEIGINLVASYEDGLIYGKDILDVDEKVYIDELTNKAREAFLLTVALGYITKDNVAILLNKAEREAKILVEKADILTSGKIGKRLVNVEKEAEVLKGKMKIEIIDNVGDKVEEKEDVESKKRREETLRRLREEENKKRVTAQDVIKAVEEVRVRGVKKMERVPSAAELASRIKQKGKVVNDKVPSAHELAQRKKNEGK